jgi:sporulation protein YlmC with PRC-barrel domain
MSAAFAVIMMATAPVAFAQTMAPTQNTNTPADRAQPSAFTTQAGKLRASEMIGTSVYDMHNRDIGKVKDVLLDSDGKVNAVVLDVGAFLGVGGKYVTVSLNDFKTDNDRLTLNRTKEQLQTAPEFHFGTR